MSKSLCYQALAAFALGWALVAPMSYAQIPPPTPTSNGSLREDGMYSVVSGDTLYGISNRFGLTVAQISSENGLGPSPILKVGQNLLLRGYATLAISETDLSRSNTYSVAAGDTLYSISRSQGVDVGMLAAANNITDPGQLAVGQDLIIPSMPGHSQSNSVPEGSSRLTSFHTVTSGETLYAIAQRYGIEVSALMQANNISDPSQLAVGQELSIPGLDGVSATGTAPNGTSVVTLPNALDSNQSGVFLDPIGPDRSSSNPQNELAEVEVTTSSATPVMLPSPPPRRGSKFRWPARGRILTNFGSQNNGQTADGIEIKVNSGAPILAAEDGVVAFAGTGISGYGYLVLIKHADDYFTAYGQNSEVSVKRGDIVEQGDIIANAGTSSTGVDGRLHFEIRYREQPVNPISYMAN